MVTFRAIRGYLRHHLRTLIVGGLLILIANLIALVPPIILQQVIDDLGQRTGTSALSRDALLIVVIALVAGVFQFFSRYVINGGSRQIEYEIRVRLFQHFQRLDLAYFQERKIGDLVARATNDLSMVRQMVGPGISNLANALVAFAVTAIAMLSIDRQLTLYSLTVMPLITVLFIVVAGRIERSYRQVQDQFGAVSARAQENFSGIRVIKAYAQECYELADFNQSNREYVQRSIAYAKLNSLLWPAMYFVSGLAIAILLWRGGMDVISGRIQLGELVRFNTYLAALTWPMIALGYTVNLYQQGAASMSRIQEVLTAVPAISDGPTTNAVTAPTRGAVVFDHVSLAYGGHEVLHDISIEVPAGTSLAIVGPTGAGKSSLVNLLARVYDVTAGSVRVDGQDVRRIPLVALRAAIGYVPQESFLFSLSIAENVALGVGTLDAERLEHALEVSQLGKDVAEFPRGAQTMIGERGVTLSGGQQQRAGIARAVAKDPLILILDDALSSVDTHTEADILRGLHGLMRNRTTIMIAHRISTIKDLDQIIVLDDGRVRERGTHQELLARGDLYAEMYRRQLLGEELADENEPRSEEPKASPRDVAPGKDGAAWGDQTRASAYRPGKD